MAGFGNGSSTGFDHIEVTVERSKLLGWIERRKLICAKWLAKKEETLEKMLKDEDLTRATLESLLRGRSGNTYSVAGKGGQIESHKQAELTSLVDRIGGLRSTIKRLADLHVGFSAAAETSIKISVGTIASLRPAEDDNPRNEDDED